MKIEHIEESLMYEETVHYSDIKWLIRRAKRYEKALHDIAELPDDESTALIVDIVRKALSDK